MLLVALCTGSFLHTRFLVYNNPRYVLPLSVFLVSVFVIECVLLWKQYPRCTRVGIAILLLAQLWSQFHTADPLSRIAFRTFTFGDHQLLSSGGFRHLPENYGWAYYGRDQLAYNFQFTKLSDLAEQSVRQFGADVQFVTGPAFEWGMISDGSTQ